MEPQEQTTKKPTKGTWGSIGESDERKVIFDFNIPITLSFLTDDPEEIESQAGNNEVYYKFQVKVGEEEKYFTTSAWTLLFPLKELAPLKDKQVTITKKSVKGKQNYEVVEVSKI